MSDYSLFSHVMVSLSVLLTTTLFVVDKLFPVDQPSIIIVVLLVSLGLSVAVLVMTHAKKQMDHYKLMYIACTLEQILKDNQRT